MGAVNKEREIQVKALVLSRTCSITKIMQKLHRHCQKLRILLCVCSLLVARRSTGTATTAAAFFSKQQVAAPFSRPLKNRIRISAINTRRMASSSSKDAATLKATTTGRLSPRVLETLDPCVVIMKELIGRYAHLWDTQDGILSLAQGVVYWEPPISCQQALQNEFSRPGGNLLHTYGPAKGIPELTEALEEKIGLENGLTNHNVMVTVGANQAFVNCVLTCLCDDSKAVVFSPYYFNHVMALQMCCGHDSVVVGPSNIDEGGIPDLQWLEETLQKQKIDMVIITNPGNPTGVSLSKEVLQRAVDLCQEYSAWLVLDCTYEYFTSEEDQPVASFPDAPHVIHIYSFSKSYSLAGYRCGYLCLSKDALPNDLLLSSMLKVQDTLPICPPRISQIAALGALKAGKQWVRDQYATLDASRQAIIDSLKPLDIMGGSGAMYLMAHLPPNAEDGSAQDDIEICRRLVEEYGVAIIPGTYCGFPGWIRVCYANLKPEMCLLAADRLQRGIRDIVLHQD
jgi:aspartate/methionine/tyrosine aminotransferase